MGHASWPICEQCNGHGQFDDALQRAGKGGRGAQCPECEGAGRIRPKDWVDTVLDTCPTCEGAGAVVRVRGSDMEPEKAEAPPTRW